MRLAHLAAISVFAGLSACAGLDRAREYNDTEVVSFEFNDATWRIFDKPAEGRLMITPSLGATAMSGVWEGLTFGIADTDIPKPTYQVAVVGWLKHTGRSCQITDGYKVISPQWEFTYNCATPSPLHQ